jgi:hypothetical protein
MKIIVVSFTIAFSLSVSAHGHAQPLNTALFDFEMIDTSLEGEMHGARRDEQIRLNRVRSVAKGIGGVRQVHHR